MFPIACRTEQDWTIVSLSCKCIRVVQDWTNVFQIVSVGCTVLNICIPCRFANMHMVERMLAYPL